MKTLTKIAAAALVINSASAMAFFNDNGNTNGYVGNVNNGEFVGNGTGRGEADFTMSVEAEGRTNGNFTGNGNTNGNFYGNGYGSDRNEDGSVVSGANHDGKADVASSGAGEGKFKMTIGFKARGDMNADTKAVADTNTNGYGYGYSSPYYGQAPYALEAK